MKYNRLGATDLEVSEICLGTMTFGEQNTEAEGHQQMDYALDQGVNFFDTAELYAVPSTADNNGKTEDIIGTWVAKSGKREQVVLATKVTGPSANLKYISDNLGFSRERIMEAVDRSLRRLQTDYIDLYQLHWPERKTNMFGQRGYVKHDSRWQDNIADVVQTLADLVKAGKIRHWGLSNETPWGVWRYINEADLAGASRPVSIQNPYNLLNRLYEVGLAEVSIREQMGLLAYSPMAFGLLSGKYHEKVDTARDRLNKYKPQMTRYQSDNCQDATRQYYDLAKRHGLSLAQMSLAYVTSRPFVTSNIIGATTMQQLTENIGSAKVELSSEVIAGIEAIHGLIPNPAP